MRDSSPLLNPPFTFEVDEFSIETVDSSLKETYEMSLTARFDSSVYDVKASLSFDVSLIADNS